METKKISLKTVLISLLAVMIVEAASRSLLFKVHSHTMLVLGSSRLIDILFLLEILNIWEIGPASIGLTRSTLIAGFRRGLVWVAGFGLLAGLAYLIFIAAGVDAVPMIKTHLPAAPAHIYLFFIVGGLLGPVAEEIFFRGIIYGFLRRWGVPLAILLSTVMFVLAHPVFPGIPLPQVVGGVVFALAYEREGSLMVPVTLHTLGNVAIFSISMVA